MLTSSSNNAKTNTAFLWNANYFFQFYCFFGAFFPFFALWLQESGAESEAIGVIIASGLVCRCLSGIGIGSNIKKQSQYLPLLKLLSALSLVMVIVMMFTSNHFWSLLMISCLFNIVIAPIFGITEAMATFLNKRNVLDYGRTRLWGSMGFVCATVLCGYLFEIYTSTILPLLLTVFALSLLGSAMFTPSTLKAQLAHDTSTQTALNDEAKMTHAPVYLFFIIVVLIQASHSFLYGFSSVYWSHLELSKTVIGYAWAMAVVGEVLMFIVARHLFANQSIVTLLALASLACILRWTGLAYAESAISICLIQLLHGGTFAITQLATIKGMQQFMSDSQLASSQGLIQGINIALTATLTYFCGRYYDTYLGNLFFVMALIGVVCLLLCFVFYARFGNSHAENA